MPSIFRIAGTWMWPHTTPEQPASRVCRATKCSKSLTKFTACFTRLLSVALSDQ